MPTIFTCDAPSGDVKKSYPDPALKLCVEVANNQFAEKRVDQVEVGDKICHLLRPGPSLEVTNVEVV